MRLLCVANRYPPWSTGGYETISAAAAAAFGAAGHEVRVLTTLPDPSDRAVDGAGSGEVRRELRWYWRNHEFPSLTLPECLALERCNGAILRAHLEAFQPDAVVWWAMGGMSLSLLEQVHRAEVAALGVVCDEWMLYGPSVDGWIRRWRGRGRALAGRVAERVLSIPTQLELGRVARWVFISAYLRDVALQSGLELRDPVIAHAGIDPRRFAPRPAAPWRWQLLYCGRIDPRKGIATAIEALRHLPSEATLTVVGEGDTEHAGELARLAAALGVEDRLEFRSSDPQDVPDVYEAADALVFPVTWREPWGLVPLESMGVGRPVVASRAGGGAAEYLRDGYNCLQFEPRDAAGLAAAVKRLACDTELRKAVRDGGAATAARFTEGAFHEALEHELQSLVAPARRPRRSRTPVA